VKITACLCWYDERPEDLERCVHSLADVVDELVAFDGRWELFPRPERGEGHVVHSPLHQQFALVEAAASIELPLTREEPRELPWPSQVAKRDALMRQAAIASGWMLVIDADEYVESADVAGIRTALEQTGGDVASAMTKFYNDGNRGPSWPVRKFYRASAGVTIETGHNGYRTADGRWLHGPTEYVDVEPSEDLSHLITVAHDTTCRPIKRQQAKRDYRRARSRERVEAWT
jgi:hypothetical protein